MPESTSLPRACRGRASDRRGRFCALVAGLPLGVLLACTPLSRNEPSLEEKCAELAHFCDAVPEERRALRECAQIGRRGMRDEDAQDRCFAAYDECIDECYAFFIEASEADAASPDGG